MEGSESAFCSREFRQIFRTFATTLFDHLHAGGAAGTRPQLGSLPTLTSVLPPAERVVAIGDLHGDLHKTRRAFRLARLIDEQDRWVGGNTVVVQVGDVLDRGDAELQILYYLERLQQEAAAAGGAVHLLNGNHETMSVAGQFRYATPGAMHSFQRWLHDHVLEGAMLSQCGCDASEGLQRLRQKWRASHIDTRAAREAAVEPGGPITMRFFVRQPVVLQVGSSVFVHGGLLPQHVEHGIDRLNRETQEWMAHGPAKAQPAFLRGRQAVVWTRDYSAEDPARVDCEKLTDALRLIPGAKRMIVGHTIQGQGINTACQGQVVRIDVGMSQGCGNSEPEVLEIVKDAEIRRLTEDKTIKSSLTEASGMVEQSTKPQRSAAEAARAAIKKMLGSGVWEQL